MALATIIILSVLAYLAVALAVVCAIVLVVNVIFSDITLDDYFLYDEPDETKNNQNQ